jgi:Fe2+ or Zn2+ uptake regulation protein
MDELTRKLIELSEQIDIENDARVNKNTRGHVWKLNDRGHVDIDGSSDFHNHVQCSKCGYVYCIACHDIPPKACTK